MRWLPHYSGGVPERNLAIDLTLYTLARLGLLVITAAALTLAGVPLLVSAAVSVVAVLPLSLLLFGSLRRRVATGIAERTQLRRQRRAQLRAELQSPRENSSMDPTATEDAAEPAAPAASAPSESPDTTDSPAPADSTPADPAARSNSATSSGA